MDFDSLVDDSQKNSSLVKSNSISSEKPISFDDLQDDEEKYGGATGAAKAFAASAARTSTLGLSDYVLNKTGLSSPEALRGYEEQNPTATALGIPAGIMGMLALGPESAAAKGAAEAAELAGSTTKGIQAARAAANTTLKGFEGADLLNPVKTLARLGGTVSENPYIGKILGQAGATALGSIAEGSFYTLGNAVSEDQLGDPNAFGESLVANLGTNALISGTLGAAFGAFKGRAMVKAAEKAENIAPGVVSDAPKTGVKPSGFQDIADKVAAAKADGKSIELPQKSVLEDAINRIEMKNPVHPLQMKSLEDQSARDLYNTFKETSGKTGDALRGYETIQKNELVNKVEQTIADLSPKIKPTADATEGGNRAIKAFTDQYQKEKDELSPIFNNLKTKPIGESGNVLTDVVQKMTDAVPGIAKMLKTEGEDLTILPYKTSWGIDKATYSAAKEAINSLKDNPSDFESIANIRRGLDQHVDVLAQGQAPAQIRSLKAAMMDYIQDAVQKVTPDIKVRDVFKRYAINEQERSVIEKVFGASVGSSEFGAISKVKPEVIGDRIFSNTASVKAAKNILPKESFNEIRSNWLSEAQAAATDKGAFSSNKFASFLRKNQDALKVAFSDDPEALQRLGDLTTIMRILPDAPSINPSGTAKTLMGMLKNLHIHDMTWEGMIAQIPKKLLEGIGKQRQMSLLNDELAGISSKVDSLSLVERTYAKIKRSIINGVSSIFSEKPLERIPAVSPQLRKEKHDKIKDLLSEYSANPEKIIDHLSKNTEALSQNAPKTSQSVQVAMIRAGQLLESKLPGNNIPKSALSAKYEPSDSELSKWQRYLSIVEEPTKALHQVAQGNLMPETMETLKVVYPTLLTEMQKQVSDGIANMISKDKNVPHRTKLMLSMFLGQDLVLSLDPRSMLSNQAILSQSQQTKDLNEATQMKGANRKHSSKMEESNRLLTPMQETAQRKEV